MKNKVLPILIISCIIILVSSTVSFCAYKPEDFKSQIITDGTGAYQVKTTGGQIVGIIRVIGTIISVAMLIILGIKYMIGSAEEKAAYKKSLFPYLIGAILLFAASNLAQVIYDWATKL